MKIAFFSNQIGLRGTEVALFDYAHYNEQILGNESIICSYGRTIDETALNKFNNRFGKVHFINNLNSFVEQNKVDIFYKICFGTKEDIPLNCKTVIHTVFGVFQPHGTVYSYVSKHLRDKMVPHNLIDQYDYVPHMINLPDISGDLREDLNIPKNATVFGYYGGNDSFNIDFVKRAIVKNIDKASNIYFLFMNIDKFYDHKRILHLAGNSDLNYKCKFINSCNAMIHARQIGETFGIACGEFSSRGKPVITCKFGNDLNHLDILGKNAILYSNEDDVRDIIINFEKYYDNSIDYNSYKDFTPSKVMKKFKEVYIN